LQFLKLLISRIASILVAPKFSQSVWKKPSKDFLYKCFFSDGFQKDCLMAAFAWLHWPPSTTHSFLPPPVGGCRVMVVESRYKIFFSKKFFHSLLKEI
jgi:hypothetical protein